jgi:hypothetical protein
MAATIEPIEPTEDDTGTVNVRRISWEAFWRIRPDLRPANDNRKAGRKQTGKHAA